MTTSEHGTSSARSPYGTGSIQDSDLLGVLTGQVPVKSMPIARKKGSTCASCGWVGVAVDHDCPEDGSE